MAQPFPAPELRAGILWTPRFFRYMSEVFKKGLAGGGWRPTAPKKTAKIVPQNCVLLLIRGHRKKGTGKRPQSMVWEGFPCANPFCPPSPFSTPLKHVYLCSATLRLYKWSPENVLLWWRFKINNNVDLEVWRISSCLLWSDLWVLQRYRTRGAATQAPKIPKILQRNLLGTTRRAHLGEEHVKWLSGCAEVP